MRATRSRESGPLSRRHLLALALVATPFSSTAMAFEVHGDASATLTHVRWDIVVEGEIVDATLTTAFGVTGTVAENAYGELRFPLPPLAVVRGADVWRDAEGRFIAGETMGRRLGEEIHRDETTTHEPLLVQEIGRDAYRAVVSPLVEENEVVLRVRYAHLLEGIGETRTLRLALGNTDARTPVVETWDARLQLVPGACTSVALARSREGTEVSFDVATGLATIVVEPGPLVDDIEVALTCASFDDVTAHAYRSTTEGVPTHVLVRAAPPVATFSGTKSESRTIVFVLDTSGSMGGQRILEAKRALRAMIEALAPGDRFGVVAFSSGATTLSPGLVDVSDAAATATVVAAMDAHFDGGGTNVEAGLSAAGEILKSDGDLSATADILLLSDGLPTSGSTSTAAITGSLSDIDAELAADLRLFALGIGYGLDQSFLNTLVTSFDGEATFALDDGEIVGQALLLFEGIKSGGLRSPTLSLERSGVPFVTVPTRTLFDDAVVSIGGPFSSVDDPADDDDVVVGLRLIGQTSEGPTTWSRTATATPSSIGVALAVPALGAKVRADALARQMEREGESEELLVEALFIAKHFGIVTRYSSFIVLADDARYDALGIARVPRDAAGIALVEVDTSEATEEARIGGEGSSTYGGSSSGSYGGGGYGGGGGCTCVAEPRARFFGIAGLALLVFLLAPRRRSTMGAR